MSAAISDPPGPQTIRLYVGSDATRLAAKIWPCYDTVFADFADCDTWRSDLFERHARRDGYRAAVATEDDEVVGFNWGYVGQRGQYWTDLVWDALQPDLARTWVGGHFELVELAVLPVLTAGEVWVKPCMIGCWTGSSDGASWEPRTMSGILPCSCICALGGKSSEYFVQVCS